jgi:hypothetical protein
LTCGENQDYSDVVGSGSGQISAAAITRSAQNCYRAHPSTVYALRHLLGAFGDLGTALMKNDLEAG